MVPDNCLPISQLDDVKNYLGDKANDIFEKSREALGTSIQDDDDPIDVERREKVKEAMLHAWNSYVKYAWGQDELQV